MWRVKGNPGRDRECPVGQLIEKIGGIPPEIGKYALQVGRFVENCFLGGDVCPTGFGTPAD